MVLPAGKVNYFFRKGVDGILDVNLFSCMNGIVSEALYPRRSQDQAGLPIKNIYVDGMSRDPTSDIVVSLEQVEPTRPASPTGARTPGALPDGPAASFRPAVSFTCGFRRFIRDLPRRSTGRTRHQAASVLPHLAVPARLSWGHSRGESRDRPRSAFRQNSVLNSRQPAGPPVAPKPPPFQIPAPPGTLPILARISEI